jgi:hypothetical protein
MANLDATLLATLKTAIEPGAPTLASLLDGPNAIISIRAVAKTLLGDSEAPLPDVVTSAQTADKLKLAAAEQEAQLRVRQNSSRSLQDLAPPPAAEPATTAPAAPATRQTQIAEHDATAKWLAYIVTAAFFGLIAILLYASWKGNNLPSDAANLLLVLLGVVATGWSNIIGFYFGSSAGSAQKSQTISDALLQANKGAAPSKS